MGAGMPVMGGIPVMGIGPGDVVIGGPVIGGPVVTIIDPKISEALLSIQNQLGIANKTLGEPANPKEILLEMLKEIKKKVDALPPDKQPDK